MSIIKEKGSQRANAGVGTRSGRAPGAAAVGLGSLLRLRTRRDRNQDVG